jgi:hypothetical protein
MYSRNLTKYSLAFIYLDVGFVAFDFIPVSDSWRNYLAPHYYKLFLDPAARFGYGILYLHISSVILSNILIFF